MFQTRLRDSVAHVGEALREPEAFALRWQQGGLYRWHVFAALALTAILGTTAYGLVMGLGRGPAAMFRSGLTCTLAAGTAWAVPLPALYILNSLTGSRLGAGTTFLAALVTTSWGGLALLAALPVGWFFAVALETFPVAVLAAHLAVFAAVGVAMIDVFCRVIERLEPRRGRAPGWWLLLVGAIGSELFYAFDLFRLPGTW
jgi:hypothetical protein